MKELLEDYRRKSKTLVEMINIAKDPIILLRLLAKHKCYFEFMIDLELLISCNNENTLIDNMNNFINSLDNDNTTFALYSIKKGFFPYLGEIKYDELTPMSIINMVYDTGKKEGIELGKYKKMGEIRKALGIIDEN